MYFRTVMSFAAAAVFSTLAGAQEYKLNGLVLEKPYARETVPNQPAGGAFVTIENKGNTDDKLVGASSPAAKKVELHTMTMDGNVMKMREVPSIELKAGARVEMKPGQGYHLMLMGLQQPLKAGEKFPITLVFEKAGKTEVSFVVQSMKGEKPAGGHHMH
ncbi:MAG TPA: copper chaperone PCu(A)C [Noviherbaspirillum sp.]